MTIYHLRITQLTMMIIELVITKYDDMIMVVFANGFTAGGKLKLSFYVGQHYLI